MTLELVLEFLQISSFHPYAKSSWDENKLTTQSLIWVIIFVIQQRDYFLFDCD